MKPVKVVQWAGVAVAIIVAAVFAYMSGLSPFNEPDASREAARAPAVSEQRAGGTENGPAADRAEGQGGQPASTAAGTAQDKASAQDRGGQESAPAPQVTTPSFDIVRVEPDGSLVVAGSAGAEAGVELISGTRKLGETKASLSGDFAIVLDIPLKPGDYQLVLRSTETDGRAATSLETAIVAVPETEEGQVLALVEEPGKPSRLITTPAPPRPKPQDAAPAQTAQAARTETTPAGAEPAPDGREDGAAGTQDAATLQAGSEGGSGQPAAGTGADETVAMAVPGIGSDRQAADAAPQGADPVPESPAAAPESTDGTAEEAAGEAGPAPAPAGDGATQDARAPQAKEVAGTPRAPGGAGEAAPSADGDAAGQPDPAMKPRDDTASASGDAPVQTAMADPSAGRETGAADGEKQQTADDAAPRPEPDAAPANAAEKPLVLVEAVEIEGRRVFVAGAATGGARVRVYANEILLGDAPVTDGGRFLVEATRDLPVGDYIVRADLLAANNADVIARAAVPFRRAEGEAIAAVAPRQPEPQAGTGTRERAGQPATDAEEPGRTATQAGSAQQQPAREDAGGRSGERLAAAEPGTDGTSPPESGGQAAPETDGGANAPADRKAATREDEPAAMPGSVSETVATTAPALEATDGSVIIRRGDTLWQISRRVYGRGVRYSTIYLANQEQIADPDRIWPGQVFRVPDQTPEGETADMSAVETPVQDGDAGGEESGAK